jgi:hypothetical protein
MLLAEVGFLLILIAGVWLAAAEIPLFEFARARKVVAVCFSRSVVSFSSSPRSRVQFG